MMAHHVMWLINPVSCPSMHLHAWSHQLNHAYSSNPKVLMWMSLSLLPPQWLLKPQMSTALNSFCDLTDSHV